MEEQSSLTDRQVLLNEINENYFDLQRIRDAHPALAELDPPKHLANLENEIISRIHNLSSELKALNLVLHSSAY